jgi:hypothetical protein
LKIKSQKDFVSGLLFVVAGMGFAIGALNYSFGSSAKPGPGYFPFGLGVLLTLLGGAVLFKALTIEAEGGDTIGAIAWKPLIVIVAAIALFGLALPQLGLICTLPLLIALCSLAGDEFHWKSVLATCVVLTAGSYLVFIKGLALNIPVWPVMWPAG